MKNVLLVVVFAFCIFQMIKQTTCHPFSFYVKAKQTSAEPIHTETDPVQTTEDLPAPFQIQIEKDRYEITPVARYQISGKVVSTQRYYLEWNAKLSPLDLAIVWGDLVNPKNDAYLKFDHGNRFFHYKYAVGSPIDVGYVQTHASNNHIIPKNVDLEKALNLVRIGEIVQINGFLVNVKLNHEGREFTWNTSLTRTDTEGGACEIIYVEKATIGKRVYF